MCVQGSEVRVNFVVMRPAETQEEGGSGREGQHNRAGRRPEPQFFRRRSTYMKVLLCEILHFHSFLTSSAVSCWNFIFYFFAIPQTLLLFF